MELVLRALKYLVGNSVEMHERIRPDIVDDENQAGHLEALLRDAIEEEEQERGS
jgi:hypothetical protein